MKLIIYFGYLKPLSENLFFSYYRQHSNFKENSKTELDISTDISFGEYTLLPLFNVIIALMLDFA